jgi:tetratricopeptide (TPR) repeat protein
MWKYKGTSQFDIGAGYGVFEYDFFTINGEKEFGTLIDYYRNLWKRFDYFLEGYDTTENNTNLSPHVQAKMKEHNANICLTFLEEEEYKENNVRIRNMIVNEQKSDGTFNTSFFRFLFLKRKNTSMYVKQALFCAAEGLHDAAVAYYSEAIERDSDNAFLYFARGDAYAKMGKYDRAIEDYTKAIKINTNYVPAYFNRANTYQRKGNYDGAIVDYTQAIQLYPNNGRAYCNRGTAFASKDRYDEAFMDFAKAIDLNPDDDYAYINRAIAYQAKGNYDSAEADFLTALEIDPNNEAVKKYLEALNEDRIHD